MIQMSLFAKQKYSRDIENKCMDTEVGKGSGINWEVGIDIYTLLCIK